LLVTAGLVVNLIAGALLVVFTIAAVVVGQVPAAVRGRHPLKRLERVAHEET
jgi:hypothetical protein